MASKGTEIHPAYYVMRNSTGSLFYSIAILLCSVHE